LLSDSSESDDDNSGPQQNLRHDYRDHGYGGREIQIQTIESIFDGDYSDILQPLKEARPNDLVINADFLEFVICLAAAGKIRKQCGEGVTVEDVMAFLRGRPHTCVTMYHVLQQAAIRVVETHDAVPLGLIDAFDRDPSKESAKKIAFYFRQTPSEPSGRSRIVRLLPPNVEYPDAIALCSIIRIVYLQLSATRNPGIHPPAANIHEKGLPNHFHS